MAIQTFNDLYVADPTDPDFPLEPSTRLIDLNAISQGEAYGFALLGDVDWGVGEPVSTFLEGDTADSGGMQAGYHQPVAKASFRLYCRESTPALRRERVRDLAAALKTGGVLVWQLRGTEEPLFIDFFRSPLPQMLRGQEQGLFEATRLLADPKGMPVQVWCQYPPRSAPVVSDLIPISNIPDERHVLLTNPGNEPSEVIFEFIPAAGSLGAVRYGIRAIGNLSEYPDHFAQALGDGLQGIDTNDVVVAGASGAVGDLAETDFALQPTMFTRVRQIDPLVDPTSFEGLHVALLRAQINDNGDPSKFRLKLRYGFTETDLVMNACPTIEFDWRDVDLVDFVEIELGEVRVPKGVGKIVYDLYAERMSGDSDLQSDLIVLDPADYYRAYAGVNGFRRGRWHHQRFDPDELDGTGHLKKGSYRLNEDGEYARPFPVTGFPLPAGVHEVTTDYLLLEPDDPAITFAVDSDPNPTEKEIARLIIERDTGIGFADWKHLKLRNRKNHNETRKERKLRFSVSQANVDDGYKYRFKVEQTAATLDGRAVRVNHMEHSFIEAITNDVPLVIDSRERISYGAADGLVGFPAQLENTRLLLPPGESVLVATMIDLPSDAGYDDIDESQPLGRVVRTRSGHLRYTVIPRWSH